MTLISVVIPVYRCAPCLEQLHQRLSDMFRQQELDYEIILVNDASPDNAWGIICALSKRDPHVKGYKFSRNFGQHYAILHGLSESRGDYAIVMDGDLQDPPEVIPELLAKAQEGYSIVYATRKKIGYSWRRGLLSKAYYTFLNKISAYPFQTEQGTFGLINRKVIDAYLQIRSHNRIHLLLLYWLGFKSAVIEFERQERTEGKSSYSLRKLWHLAIRGILFQSTALLRWIVYAGFLTSLLGVFMGIYYIFLHFFVHLQPGWTTLVSLLLFLGGFIITCQGVVGLYIAEIFEHVQGRPLFIVESAVQNGIEQ